MIIIAFGIGRCLGMSVGNSNRNDYCRVARLTNNSLSVGTAQAREVAV
jgi:hypothetical protein